MAFSTSWWLARRTAPSTPILVTTPRQEDLACHRGIRSPMAREGLSLRIIFSCISHWMLPILGKLSIVNGPMDGFVITDGTKALGYYDGSDLPYYYALADSFTLCGTYFSYQLGPTFPNRIALWAGTSGGMTTNDRPPLGSLEWPTIVDLLDAQHVSWKCYNLGLGGGNIPELVYINTLPFFKRWQQDPRLHFKEDDYYNDLKHGTLPQVTFLISDPFTSEHPLTDIEFGQKKMAKVINALMNSSLWTSSVLFLTYDEGGGFFDHVPPPQVDAVHDQRIHLPRH